jgi:hypothetical protein
MSELQPIIPARDETSPAALPTAAAHDPVEPAPITEQEVGEYREQDRFLPVCSFLPSLSLSMSFSSALNGRDRLPMYRVS